MLLRLLFGLLKGVALGGAIGYLLGLAGMAVPPAWAAYLVAAVVGMLIALVAGKPIWRKGAKVEVGMKAAAGAIVAPLLLLASRSWLTVALPFSTLPGIAAAEGANLGNFAVTSLAMVAALLGGFFDADNSDKGEAAKAAGGATTGKRIEDTPRATVDPLDFAEAEEEEPAERKARK